MSVKDIVLTEHEERALIDLKSGLNIQDDIGLELYRHGLCEQRTALESDGSLSRIGWKITPDGHRWLYYRHCQQLVERRSVIQYTITTIIAVLALIIAIAK